MKYNSPVTRLVSVFGAALFFLTSCTRVNEATELGSDLIPVVDNVNTFDTLLSVESFNRSYTNEDSTRSEYTATQWLGRISEDPLFGATDASLFVQLLPSSKTPFAFTDKNNIIALDSVVLVLSYRSAYGDTNRLQQVQVFELDQRNVFRGDSVYMVKENNFTYTNALSSVRSYLPSQLNDSVVGFRERAANQLRIRLDNTFGNRLLRDFDSSNAYLSDSAFNSRFRGFAVVPSGTGNALMGFSLADTNTKLAVYYRYTKAGAPDTAVTSFRFAPATLTTAGAASANYIRRERGGSEFAGVAGDNVADPLVYIQNTPGTFAEVRIPGLATLSNRVVHRAELIVDQVPDLLSIRNIFTAPPLLYLDAFDATTRGYRTIPLDVNFNSNGQINSRAFGMIAERSVDPSGTAILSWRFNLSRYIQNVVNRNLPPYASFRLSGPYLVRSFIGTGTQQTTFGINPNYAVGRVRVGGGNHPTQRMRLRVIYSRL